MRLLSIFAALFLVTLMTPNFASAKGASGVTFMPSFYYNSHEVTVTGSTPSEQTTTILDAKLGYVMNNGLYLGAVYGMWNTGTQNAANDTDRTGMGASVGFISGGFNLIASYLLSTTYEQGTTEGDGSGIGVDVGYMFNLGGWSLGPQLSYRAWTYDEIKSSGTLLDGYEIEETLLTPMIQLGFMF